MTSDEPPCVDGERLLVDRYEELRRRTVDGDGDAWRWGLGVLRTRGVAAWAHAWDAMPERPERTPVVADVPAGGEQMVAVLASMALACLSGG